MKLKIFVLGFIILTSNMVSANEFNCVYTRAVPKRQVEEHEFKIMPSRPHFSSNLRTHGFSVELKEEALVVTVNEFKEVKMKSIIMTDVWGPQRSPTQPRVEISFPKAEIEIRCQ